MRLGITMGTQEHKWSNGPQGVLGITSRPEGKMGPSDPRDHTGAWGPQLGPGDLKWARGQQFGPGTLMGTGKTMGPEDYNGSQDHKET